MLMDRQTVKKRTNGWNYTNFKSNLAMMVIYLPVKSEFGWTKRFRVRDGRRTHQSNTRVGYTQPV